MPGAWCYNKICLEDEIVIGLNISNPRCFQFQTIQMWFFFLMFYQSICSTNALPTHLIDSVFPTSQIIVSQKTWPFYKVLLPQEQKNESKNSLRFVVPVGSWRQLGSLPTCSHVTGQFKTMTREDIWAFVEKGDRDRCVTLDLRVNFKLIGWCSVCSLSV